MIANDATDQLYLDKLNLLFVPTKKKSLLKQNWISLMSKGCS
jgi:hypothetical protein